MAAHDQSLPGKPWQKVAHGRVETAVIPDETTSAFDSREERIARHFREWIEAAKRRMRDGSPQN
jgi:hypothetical protein